MACGEKNMAVCCDRIKTEYNFYIKTHDYTVLYVSLIIKLILLYFNYIIDKISINEEKL